MTALESLNYRVIAVGDSYNDTAMLGAAHVGLFICPPEAIAAQFPQFAATRTFAELRAAIDSAAAQLSA